VPSGRQPEFRACGDIPDAQETPCPSRSDSPCEAYGGGGNSGAPYQNDFVELFNHGDSPVDLTGWSVQYASSTGTSWQVTKLTGSIPAGGYHLVAEGAGAGNGDPLPAADDVGTIAMSGTPMLRHGLQGMHNASLTAPRARDAKPRTEWLEERYVEFLER
jgi:predicted extracellular nuclease